MSSTNSSGWIPQLALAEHRLALLQSVTASLARAQSAHEVATVIMREALPGLQAEVGVIALLEPDGRTLRNIGFEGVGEATRDEWATYPVDSPVPVAEAALTGQLVVVPTREERNRRYPILAAVHGPDKGGPVVALPLKVEGRLNGVLGLCFGEDRGFTHQDMDFLKALADQSAIALERARLSLESSAALARLRLASDAGGFGIYERALNADLPVWENDLMYEIFGRERAAGPIGYREFRNEIVHPDDRSAYEAALARGAAEGGPVQFECRIRRRDEYRWLRLTGRVQGAADDRRLIGVMRDVTAEKSAIESLTQTAASLRQSQDVLRLAMRAGRMGAWWRDLSTEKVWWSRELEEIFGLPPGSFEGTKGGFRGLIHEEDRARFVDTVDRAIAARTEYAVEFRFRHASGEWRWMDGRGAAAYGPDGRPSALHGVGIDITDRKQAEEALRKSEERLRLTYQATGMGAWEWNAATNEVYWSPQYRELYGLDPESAPDYEAGMANVAAADRPAIESALAAALTNGAEFRSEHRIAHPERGERWILAIGNVLKDRESGATRMVGVVMDITARKRIEEALREEDRRKDEFLATLAHELRNPLAPISNAVHIIRLPDAPPDAQQAARDVIGRQVEQMVRLIDDLLDVSRISRGKLELRTEPVPLVGVLDRALETSMPHMRGHDLTVSLPQEPLTVQGDPVRLAQVFSNLLNNAAKFTEKGGRISLIAARSAARAEVRVADTGIGIEAEHLPTLFRMFSQARPALERTHGGLGIGLALSRGLVEMHGGTIEARSGGLGRGSEFIVTLPLVSARESTAAPAGRQARAYFRSKHRVLVVDDVRDSAQSLAALLRLSGNEVQMAHDGEEAIAAATEWRPEVILLDIGLPKMNGLEVCRELRAKPWGRDVAMIALTGWGQDEDRRKSLQAGFDAHFVKPVDLPLLSEFLASLGRAH